MKQNYIDYEKLLNDAKTGAELIAVFQRMTADAENISIIPSKLSADAFELFFIGLPGVNTSFIIFQEERLAKRFIVNAVNEHDILFVVIEGTIYYIPFAISH